MMIQKSVAILLRTGMPRDRAAQYPVPPVEV